jgi:hypothetical protein
MIRVSCPSCGKSLRIADELAGKRGRCPGCNSAIRIPVAPAPDSKPARQPPPPPPIVSRAVQDQSGILSADGETSPLPKEITASKSALDRGVKMDTASKSAAAMCLASLFLLCLTVFLPWVQLPVAGPGLGILRSDGVFLLVGTSLMGALAISTLARGILSRTAFICNAAWGTFACTYLAGVVLGIFRLRNHVAFSENLFAHALVQFVQPGFGLFVGSFSALCLAASSSFLATRQFSAFPTSRYAIGAHFFSILASAVIGFGLPAFHFAWQAHEAANNSKAESQSFAQSFEQAERDARELEKRDRLKRFIALGQSRVLGYVEVTPVSFELRHVSGARGFVSSSKFKSDEPVLVFTFEVKNISEGQVFNPFSSLDVLDNFGNKLECPFGRDNDVRLEGSENLKEIKPGESARMVFCRKAKINTSTSYDWEFHTCTSNSEQRLGVWESWIVHVDE